MKDRVAGAPGQYSATVTGAAFKKMQNGEPFTITLKRDDKPEVEGTPYSKAAVLPDALAEKLCPGVADPTPADALSSLARGTEEVKAELGDKKEIFKVATSILAENSYIQYSDDPTSESNKENQPECAVYLFGNDDGKYEGKTVTIRTYMYGDMALMDRYLNRLPERMFFCNEGVTAEDIAQNPELGIFEYQYTFNNPVDVDEYDRTHFHISFCENPYMSQPEVIVHKGSVWEEIKELSADYIIAQGKSGLWFYRKWNSGIAEFWGKTTGVTNEDGIVYIAYPFNTSDCVFTTGIPYASVNKVECTDLGSGLSLRYLYDNGTPFESGVTLSSFVSVKGRWK